MKLITLVQYYQVYTHVFMKNLFDYYDMIIITYINNIIYISLSNKKKLKPKKILRQPIKKTLFQQFGFP